MKRNKKLIIENRVYNSIIRWFNELQSVGTIKDGDFLAKKVSTKIAEGLLPTQQRKIYSILNETALPVSAIAKKCKLKSNVVAAQLNQMYSKTLLVGFKKNGRNKLWHRSYR